MDAADYSLARRRLGVQLGLLVAVWLGLLPVGCGRSGDGGGGGSGGNGGGAATSGRSASRAATHAQPTDDAGASDAAGTSHAIPAGDRLGGWRLEHEASPYLREHADNPVDWFPWGPEAFARAKELDRPVFLSIGYSSCHWCHVMERESFMDPGIASLLNDEFVSIKVDREQRPDIDSQYMRALMVLTDGGGWPANLFLTPDGVPFAGGTYFPPEPRFGLPGFHKLLENMHTLWTTEREELLRAAGEMRAVLAADELEELLAADGAAPPKAASAPADEEAAPFDVRRTVSQASSALVGRLDLQHGGEFGAPKFPPTLALDFLLRQHLRNGVEVLDFVDATLVAMDRGSLHDHVGGGFHRYCVDEGWTIPHFEKLLADNAQLAALYAQAFAVTGQPRWAAVARSTLAWMTAELRSPEGLYSGALDADSLPFEADGRPVRDAIPEEGRFYLWRPGEITDALGEQRGAAFAALFGVTSAGNFVDGRSIPRPSRTPAELELAPIVGLPTGAALQPWIEESCAQLARARAQRPRPMRDEKCVAGWNGLAATAFARSGALLDDAALRAEAGRLAEALLLLVQDGRVAHQRFGGVNSGAGTLFDHAAVARGLLDAYAVAPDPRFVEAALALGRTLLRFQSEDGDFFETEVADPLLPARTRELFDGALPTGSSVALETLLRLSSLDDSGALAAAAERAVARLGPLADKHAAWLPGLLTALDHAAGPLGEIVLDGSGPEYEALLRATWRTPLPAALVLPSASTLARRLAPDGEPPSVLADRSAPAGGGRAWVCVRRTCLAPAEDAATLGTQLATVVRR